MSVMLSAGSVMTGVSRVSGSPSAGSGPKDVVEQGGRRERVGSAFWIVRFTKPQRCPAQRKPCRTPNLQLLFPRRRKEASDLFPRILKCPFEELNRAFHLSDDVEPEAPEGVIRRETAHHELALVRR